MIIGHNLRSTSRSSFDANKNGARLISCRESFLPRNRLPSRKSINTSFLLVVYPSLGNLIKRIVLQKKSQERLSLPEGSTQLHGWCLQQELQEATDQPRVLICRADNSHAVVAGLLNLKSAVKPQTSFRFINAKEKINVKLLGCVVLASVVISVSFPLYYWDGRMERYILSPGI